MQIKVLTTYALNGSDEKTREVEVNVADDFTLTPVSEFDLMNRAGDALIARYELKGQLMVSGVEVLAA